MLMKKNKTNFKIITFFLLTLITVQFFPLRKITATDYNCETNCEGGKRVLIEEMCGSGSGCPAGQVCCSTLTLNVDYPEMGGIDINRNQNLNHIIAWAYHFIIGISGFAAFFKFVWAGFLWSSSRGDPAKIGEAKDEISAASIGLLLILSTYLILQTINPELTTLSLPDIQ